MAKLMLARPNFTSLCTTYVPHILRCQTTRHFQSQSFFRFISPLTKQQQQHQHVIIKPLIHIAGRRSISAGVSSPTNGSGPIDSPLMQSMQSKIKEELNAELVTVNDAYGDGRHVSIDVVSSAFEGKSAVNRQRMVYKAIWEELQNVVHAVDQMTTKTPEEAASGK
uniref:protein BOLA4, chloroplastic/mitochondrial n=1 Tax=Erigeron canadensis TaxID=72917 RepID=UPI001CB89E35|nr:protein BOLA4, chloroplastic/mitochondrial [Erigeron canadensis]